MTKQNSKKSVLKRFARGVYNLFGVNNEHKVVIKAAGMLELGQNDSVADAMIERFTVSPNVFAELYKCNIVDAYLISTKKLPLTYIAVAFEKPLVRSILFSLFLYFTIKTEVTSEKQLIGTELEGEFSIELVIDDNHKVLDTTFAENGYPGRAKTIENLKTMINSPELQPIIQSLIEKKNAERREKFLHMFPEGNYAAPPTPAFKFDDLL